MTNGKEHVPEELFGIISNSGEMPDGELESASGGSGEGPKGWKCPLCGKDTYSYGLGVVKGAIPNNPYASSYEDLYICKKHKDYLFFRKYGAAVGVLDYRRFSEVQIIEVYHAYGEKAFRISVSPFL